MSERVAPLRLRGRHGPVDTDVHWPAADRFATMVVAFDIEPGTIRSLCDATGAVVLAVAAEPPVSTDDAWEVLQWAAAHATDLGADPGRLVLLGAGAGATTARAVNAIARAEGWPPVHLVLDPSSDAVHAALSSVRSPS